VSRTTNILLAVGVLAAAVAAYWFLALGPKRDQIAKLDTDVATKQAAVQQAHTTANNYEVSRKAYRKNYETVVRLGKAVPADDDVRSLVVQVDSSAKRSQVDFSSVNIGGGSGSAASPATGAAAASAKTPPPGATVVGSAGFLAMPFTFDFQGSFFRLGDFFTQLDRYVKLNDQDVDVTGRLLRVETFTLTPTAEDSNLLKAEVKATSYLLPASEGLTAGATAQGPAAANAGTPTPPAGTTPPTTTATAGVVR
jgi:Tfp pilus assembly protein PilO